MSVKDALKEAEDKMKRTVDSFRRELAGLKAGRATPSLLDRITVDYYGTPTPVNQLATVSAPEARLLVIQPWDKSSIRAIEKAILTSDLGINPSSDGTLIRLIVPQLTGERRQQLVKQVKKRAEEERVIIRNHRRDTKELIELMEEEKQISEDEARRGQEELQKITDKYIKEIEAVLEAKEKEIMEV